MKIGGLVLRSALAILFLWCAAVQFNDPDPLPWVTGYGLVAAIFVLAVFGRASASLDWLALGVLLALALIALPGFLDFLSLEKWGQLTGSMDASRPHIEAAREFLGAVTAAIAVLVGKLLNPRLGRRNPQRIR